MATQPASAGPASSISLKPIDTRCTSKSDRSVSTTQQICDEYRVRRGVFDGNSALWDTKVVGKVDRIETVYMQKVRAGSGRPTFTFYVEIPRYRYEHNGSIWMRDENYKWVGRKI